MAHSTFNWRLAESYFFDFLQSNAAGLPVLFFIYGGGFTAGTQMMMGYERMGEVNDFVLVAINYRLGPLGERGPPPICARYY